MKRQLVLIFVVAFVIFVCMGTVSGATRYVNPSTFKNVIENVAQPGDTIVFRNGNYYLGSSLIVDKPLILRARNPGGAHLIATFPYTTDPTGNRAVIKIRSTGVTVSNLDINCNNLAAYAINANPDYYISCSITGNTISNAREFGILLSNTTNSQFSGNTISNSGFSGMGLMFSYTATITGNTVTGSDYSGIYLSSAQGTTVSDNTASNNGYHGIYVLDSQVSRVTGNTASGNSQDGIILENSPQGWIENNNANNNAITGISLHQSSNSWIFTNTANNNGNTGISLSGTDSTQIIGNTLQFNIYGATFGGSGSNTFSYNTVTNGTYGVTSSYTNTISNNLVMDNSGWGISMGTYGHDLDHSPLTDNQLYYNNIALRLIGDNNQLGSLLLSNNTVLGNNYALEFDGNSNLMNGTALFGNNNGLHLIGNNNILTNLIAAYNNLTGIRIDGNGNNIDNSLFSNNTNDLIINGNQNTVNGTGITNNTNGIIITGNWNDIYNTLFLNGTNALNITGNNNALNWIGISNNTNGITVTGDQNTINGTEIVNGTNGIAVTGNRNNITNNSVYNNSNNGIYISGNNLVTGNTITQNNGTGLVIQTNNNNVNMSNIAWNMIWGNGQGITLLGDGNTINNILMLFNVLLNNNYTLTITGNDNQLNNITITLNQNGLHVNGNNNTLSNITARNNNETGVIITGNNNSVNGSLMQNNTNGLIINGDQNTVNSSRIINNTNGIEVNGSENTLNQSNIQNNSQTAVTLNGDNNTLIQNNITGSNEAIHVENGTNNTLNYNRIAGNGHSLTNDGNGTVNATYNWWGQNTPPGITGENIDTSNQVVANLNVENTPNNIIQPGVIYNVVITLRSADGQELKMAIPPFLVHFFFNSGDIYPEEVIVVNNTASTQLQVFNPGTYTLQAVLDQQTLTTILSTPVNSQPVNGVKIPRKPSESALTNNLCGAVALANLLGGMGIQADASIIAPLAGTNEFGTTFYGLMEAAKIFGVDLHGVNLDSSQLQSGDIVLLNIDGISHYSTVLLHMGDLVILQDPLLGTVVLTMDEFNKFYTGHALTLNSAGSPLGVNELQSLSGGDLNDLTKLQDLNNVSGLQGSYLTGVDTSDPAYQKLKAKWDNLTPEEKEKIAHPFGTPKPMHDPWFALVIILLAFVGVGVLTDGVGDIALLPALSEAIADVGGAEAVSTAAESVAEAEAAETGLLEGISQWGSRALQGVNDSLKPIYNFLIDNLPYAGIDTSSRLGSILDTLSWVTFSFGPNPVGGAMIALRILALTRIPWLAENVPYNSFSASMTLTDLFAITLGVKGLSDSIWEGIQTGIGELWNNLTNSQNNRAYNGAWMINIPGAINGISNGAYELGGLISDNASRIGNWISGGISNATNAINNFVNNAVTNATDQIARVTAQAVTAAQTAYHVAAQAVQAAGQAAYHASQVAYHAAVQAAQAAQRAAVQAGQTIYHAAVSFGHAAYSAVVHAGQAIYNGAVHAGQAIYHAAVQAGQTIYNAAASAWNWLTGR